MEIRTKGKGFHSKPDRHEHIAKIIISFGGNEAGAQLVVQGDLDSIRTDHAQDVY